jgi:hypothetical protein
VQRGLRVQRDQRVQQAQKAIKARRAPPELSVLPVRRDP